MTYGFSRSGSLLEVKVECAIDQDLDQDPDLEKQINEGAR